MFAGYPCFRLAQLFFIKAFAPQFVYRNIPGYRGYQSSAEDFLIGYQRQLREEIFI